MRRAAAAASATGASVNVLAVPSLPMSDDAATLRRILRSARTIAVVGLSAEWHRPSYFAAKYMQQHGYRVIPVNPRYTEVLGERCYPTLAEIPEAIDLVDVFRRTDDVLPIAREAIAERRALPVATDRRLQRRSRSTGARGRARFGDEPAA
jgi:predicted CoA-binding protein